MKATDIVLASATSPIIKGPTAPPMGVIISSDEARLVSGPKSLSESAKIVGNMMLSNTYINTKAPNESTPILSTTANVVINVPMAQTRKLVRWQRVAL